MFNATLASQTELAQKQGRQQVPSHSKLMKENNKLKLSAVNDLILTTTSVCRVCLQ